jgi:hypothetical protein
MSPEKTKSLIEKYPLIFKNITEPSSGHVYLPITLFMFECGDGWFNILDQLCLNIQHHIDWKNKKESVVEQVVADQVKEKFGTLRFYHTGGDDYIAGLVTMAESMSGVTCEDCGKPGRSRGFGWITTVCDEHAEERNIEE